MSDLQMTVPVLFLLSVVIVFRYRRFRRSAFDAHWTCHVAAAIGLVFGVVTTIGGVGHSVNVAYLAWNEPEYGPLQILRFTTGAMLIYTGAEQAEGAGDHGSFIADDERLDTVSPKRECN